MKVFTYNNGFDYRSEKGISLCLGFFDGLHLGHQALIKRAVKENKEVGVLTFTGSMKMITGQRKDGAVITSLKEREYLLEKLGVKFLFVLPFTPDIFHMPAEAFIKDVLEPLNIKKIYIGSDFRFGDGAKGDASLLSQYFDTAIVNFIMADKDKKISTRDIVSLIKEGKIEEANKYLGRDYSIEGKIVHGFHNGTSIGFPTANIEPDTAFVIPKNGVYATRVIFRNRTYLSMTNIGIHPTIDELAEPDIETNIFDFKDDVYDDTIILRFLSFIRDEQKFSSLSELVEQLKKDKSEVIKRFQK